MPLPTAGPSQRGRYGIDGGFAGLAVFGLVEAGLAGTVTWAAGHRKPGVAALAGVGGAVVAGSAASYLYSTGPGKRAIWARLLDELGLRGDEHVLDVGCGRGAVLMLAARRLPTGEIEGSSDEDAEDTWLPVLTALHTLLDPAPSQAKSVARGQPGPASAAPIV